MKPWPSATEFPNEGVRRRSARGALGIAFLIGLLICAPAHAAVLAVTYGGDLLEIDESTGVATSIGPTGFSNLNGLARDASGRLYAVTQDGRIIELDPDTGSGTLVAALPLPSPVHIVRAIAVSLTGELYFAHGSLHEASDDTLARFDLARRSTTTIDILRVTGESPVTGLTGLAFAADGRLIGWDQALYGLIEIDPATAVATRRGPRLGPPGANIETLAYADDGTLHGIGGFATAGRDHYFDFDAPGVPTSHVSVGPYDIRGMEFRAPESGEDPPDPDPTAVQQPGRRPPHPPLLSNLYLVDCGPCPQCLERPCDPRVNPDRGAFLIWDPLRKVAQGFTRKELGLLPEDGPIAAAAPLYGVGGQPLFVIAAPLADKGGRNAGAIVIVERNGRVLRRLDGQVPGERLGLSMDVRQGEIVVVSQRRLLRLRGVQTILDKPLASELRADRGVVVAFTNDVDGDRQPEILLGTPQAAAGAMARAGRIEVLGSSRGQTIDVQYGHYAGQQLGRSLRTIADREQRQK